MTWLLLRWTNNQFGPSWRLYKTKTMHAVAALFYFVKIEPDSPCKSWGASSFPSKHDTGHDRKGFDGLLHLPNISYYKDVSSYATYADVFMLRKDFLCLFLFKNPPIVVQYTDVCFQRRQEEFGELSIGQYLWWCASDRSYPYKKLLIWQITSFWRLQSCLRLTENVILLHTNIFRYFIHTSITIFNKEIKK